MIAQTLKTVSEDRGSGRFPPEQIAAIVALHNIQPTSQFSSEEIAATILKHKIQPTSQFSAQQIAERCLEASQRQFVHRYVNPRTASRRHQRGHSYGDCHWGGK